MDTSRRAATRSSTAIAFVAVAVTIATAASLLGGCSDAPKAKAFIQSLYLGPDKAKEVRTDDYKTLVAQRIETVNAEAITPGRPQAMLRSVVIVSFVVDRNGRILRSSVFRTNGDDVAEKVAITTLRRSAPLPVPPTTVLNAVGQVELMEGWLFNTDGRFQLQTLAAPQQDGGDTE